MGNLNEEEKLNKDLDNLDRKELEINGELYKIQIKINQNLPERKKIRLKKNYLQIIEKRLQKLSLKREKKNECQASINPTKSQQIKTINQIDIDVTIENTKKLNKQNENNNTKNNPKNIEDLNKNININEEINNKNNEDVHSNNNANISNSSKIIF